MKKFISDFLLIYCMVFIFMYGCVGFVVEWDYTKEARGLIVTFAIIIASFYCMFQGIENNKYK